LKQARRCGDENGVFGVGSASESTEGEIIKHQIFRRRDLLKSDILIDLAHPRKVAAGNDDAGIVDNAYGSVDRIAHLMNYTLEQSV